MKLSFTLYLEFSLSRFKFRTKPVNVRALGFEEGTKAFCFPHSALIDSSPVSLTLLFSLLEQSFSGGQFTEALLSGLFKSDPVFIKLLSETLC